MAITMKNYGLRWTGPDGTPQAAGVSYDQASADAEEAVGGGEVRGRRDRRDEARGEAPAEGMTAAAWPPVGSREERRAPHAATQRGPSDIPPGGLSRSRHNHAPEPATAIDHGWK